MRRIALASALLALAGSCTNSSGGLEYANNDLQLITGYTAKEFCSCLFVMEQTEDFCRAWTKASPAVATVRIDREHKVVESSAGLMWGARAHFVDERFGCLLE